ncbi:STN domain-containing protein [Niastella populi]|uniref:Secretin/TonB short N-terminal domain-containing protein n=1 Tax=Niastella populi TaxID=550983 RepID=A0A1V9GD40_9BACT|nr:STN domain-containing protein [Niastella populi]OQP68589.1 hypothetical protein A4R26_01970 [Niastella populi]
MDVINKRLSALFVLIILTACGSSFAQNRSGAPGSQRVQFHFDKPITLDSLTRYVHRISRIRFSFNSTKVKGTKLIDLKKGTYSIGQLLQQIRQNTSLYYSMYNGYVIFQDNPPKQKKTTPPVTKTNNTKPPVRKAAIASHKKPVSKPNTEKHTPPLPEKITKTDTAKITADSAHTADSTLVFTPGDSLNRLALAPKPHVQQGSPPDDTETRNRHTLKGIPHIQVGLVPVDTTTIDTLQIKDKPVAPKTTVPPAASKKKARTVPASSGNRVDYDSEGTDWNWQYGLHWKGALPLYETNYYFTGIDTRSQLYNPLIPGAWVSLTANGRHELMLLIKPAEWYYYNKKDFRTDTEYVLQLRPDSVVRYDTIRSVKSDRLLKTTSWYGSLQYNFHFSEKFMIGAGIGYHLNGEGLVYRRNNRQPGGELLSDTLFGMKNDTARNLYMASSFITGKLEMAYRINALDVGASLLMPITGPFKDKSLNKSRPLNVQLFVRWRIKRNEDE